jgi:hypothetical protein
MVGVGWVVEWSVAVRVGSECGWGTDLEVEVAATAAPRPSQLETECGSHVNITM